MPTVRKVQFDLLTCTRVEPAVDVAGNLVLIGAGGGLRRVVRDARGK